MQVQPTVYKMMRESPSLYPTRAIALLSLFDSFHTEWVNGELINTDRSGDSRFCLPYAAEEVADPANPFDGYDVSEVIFKRKVNAQVQFVYDNAHLLSTQRLSRLDKRNFISFDGKRFADMPENVTDEWLEAAKELAFCVLSHVYWPDRSYTAEYERRGKESQAQAVKVCNQFLERFKAVPSPCPYTRAARVKELLREAQALGMSLTEADGSPPKTAV